MSDPSVIAEDERALRSLELAELHFPPERRRTVAAFLQVPEDNPALLPFLAWCAQMGFSPVSGRVWLAPVRTLAVDGEPEQVRYEPAIGRDGLLDKARETKGKRGGFKGMQSEVVCEHDTYEVEYSGDAMNDPKVLHRFRSKPTQFEAEDAPEKYRGRVLGAWCKVYVDGEPPTFYFASVAEHGRRNAETGEWADFWTYTSAMSLKTAQSYCLRVGLGITGVMPVDEIRPRAQATAQTAAAAKPIEMDYDFGQIAEEVRERLEAAVRTANSQEAFSWPPAKCEMVFAGRSVEQLFAIVEEIEAENDRRAAKLGGAADKPGRITSEITAALQKRRAELLAEMSAGTEEDGVRIRAELDRLDAELRSFGADPT